MCANTDALRGLIHMAEKLLSMAAGFILELAITLRQGPEHNSFSAGAPLGTQLSPQQLVFQGNIFCSFFVLYITV